jgi:hypothetical protein
MLNEANKQLIFVVYDGIGNSVFYSQVIAPLLDLINQSANLEVTIVSFESKKVNYHNLADVIPAHEKLHLVICRKIPFIGKISLLFATVQLFCVLRRRQPCHEIIARGPLAGYIVYKALSWWSTLDPARMRADAEKTFPSVMVQARGLCAEEYRYTHKNEKSNFLVAWWRHHMFKIFWNIEFEVYRSKRKTDYPNDVTIECVSSALKDHLEHIFRADPARIILAIKDLPKALEKESIQQFRQKVREKLKISADALVYCYSGSWRPWQCADKTVEYFVQEFAKNPQAFFLVLSQDKAQFEQELKKYNVPTTAYAIIKVQPTELQEYLAAADFGMLLREPDIINWVSRPTKMLEYQAAGLEIIHNNTVAWLTRENQ